MFGTRGTAPILVYGVDDGTRRNIADAKSTVAHNIVAHQCRRCILGIDSISGTVRQRGVANGG